MNVEGLEEKKNRNGNISYWKDGEIVYKQCSRCKQIKRIELFKKRKREQSSCCKECEKLYDKKYRKANVEKINKHQREYNKQYRKDNAEKIREAQNNYYQKNREYYREYDKQYRESQKRKEYLKKYNKERYSNVKKENIQRITEMVYKINTTFRQLNLPVYGYIYKFENIKTGKVYIGQTIRTLKQRYKVEIINEWIEERKKYEKQKFLEELIEEDIKLTEVLDVGCCQYHLDKLEVYYINKYDSCDNGYNNEYGNHVTDDGLEEFVEILQRYNIEFIDGEIKEKRLPKQA
jgi:hypothetical protein